MAKKKTEIQELSEFIRDHMVTKDHLKDELKAALDPIKKTLTEHTKTLAEHTEILNEHTRDLNIIKKDVERNLDKRLTLEARATNIEKKVFGAARG